MLFPSTIERIARLCPNLVTIKVLMEDLNFRELEMLNMVEEVVTSFHSLLSVILLAID